MRLLLLIAGSALLLSAQSPLETILHLALEADQNEIQRHLFDYTKTELDKAGQGVSLFHEAIQEEHKERGYRLVPARQGARPFRLVPQNEGEPEFEVCLDEEKVELPDAIVRFSIRAPNMIWVRIAVRVRQDAGAWKLIGFTVAKANSRGEWNDPDIEDIRLMDPAWFAVMRAGNREAVAVSAKVTIQTLLTTIQQYRMEYDRWPKALDALFWSPEGHRSQPGGRGLAHTRQWLATIGVGPAPGGLHLHIQSRGRPADSGVDSRPA
jgi:hypothetical protein